MKVHWPKSLLPLLLLPILIGAGLLVWSLYGAPGPTSVSLTVPNAFYPAQLAVGDKVAGMTVSAIAPLNKSRPINFAARAPNSNYRIFFIGDAVASGRYQAQEQRLDGWVLYLDPQSARVLPDDATQPGTPENQAGICIYRDVNQLPDLGRQGTVSFRINEFIDNGGITGGCIYELAVTDVLSYEPDVPNSP